MIEWFTEQQAGMLAGIIGACFGCWAGVICCWSGFCIRKGLKKLYYSLFGITIATISLVAITGLIALLAKQPHHVWFMLLLPGSLGTVIIACLFPIIRKRFTDHEMRQIQARDL